MAAAPGDSRAELPPEIDALALEALRAAGGPLLLLDVREPWEVEICALPGSLAIPMAEVPQRLAELPGDRPVIVLCHHGQRSARVTQWLRQRGLGRATNLAGGIDAWARIVDPSLPLY